MPPWIARMSIRYDAYVGERGIPLANANKQLSDPLDECSVSFLVSDTDGDIGTVRYLKAADSLIETTRVPEWRQWISRLQHSIATVEVGRMVVAASHRGKSVVSRLLRELLHRCVMQDVEVILFACALGPYVRLYAGYGAEPVDVP